MTKTDALICGCTACLLFVVGFMLLCFDDALLQAVGLLMLVIVVARALASVVIVIVLTVMEHYFNRREQLEAFKAAAVRKLRNEERKEKTDAKT